MKPAVLIAAAMLVTGCTAAELPLAKTEPVANAPSSLVRPPWEAMVHAGPGAAQDIDLETLDGSVAEVPQAGQSTMPTGAPVASDGAIRNVYVAPVAGKNDAATAALTAAMRRQLSEAGWPVLNSPRKDALTIVGKFGLGGGAQGGQAIKLDWTVKMPSGKVLGVVSQKNTISGTDIQAGWSQLADAATAAAADGIFELVGKAQAANGSPEAGAAQGQ